MPKTFMLPTPRSTQSEDSSSNWNVPRPRCGCRSLSNISTSSCSSWPGARLSGFASNPSSSSSSSSSSLSPMVSAAESAPDADGAPRKGVPARPAAKSNYTTHTGVRSAMEGGDGRTHLKDRLDERRQARHVQAHGKGQRQQDKLDRQDEVDDHLGEGLAGDLGARRGHVRDARVVAADALGARALAARVDL